MVKHRKRRCSIMSDSIDKKLAYLDETKEMIRQAISSKGQLINVNEPFRQYVQHINNIDTSGDVKLFATQEAMQNDKTSKKGDLAIVYRSEINNWNGSSAITSFTFPKTVTLPSARTGNCYGYAESPSTCTSTLFTVFLRLTCNRRTLALEPGTGNNREAPSSFCANGCFFH